MTEKKSYNLDALTGGDTDDMDLCQQYGINPQYAYTPKINDVMFETIRESSINDLIRAGKSREEAIRTASEWESSAKARAKELMK